MPIENISEEISPAIQLLFTPKSRQLIVASRSGEIQVFALQDDSVTLSQRLSTASGIYARIKQKFYSQ